VETPEERWIKIENALRHLIELQAKHAEEQARHAEKQAKHAEEQSKLAEGQARLGEEQAKRAEEHAKYEEEAREMRAKILETRRDMLEMRRDTVEMGHDIVAMGHDIVATRQRHDEDIREIREMHKSLVMAVVKMQDEERDYRRAAQERQRDTGEKLNVLVITVDRLSESIGRFLKGLQGPNGHRE
jgi:hypothetical protein